MSSAHDQPGRDAATGAPPAAPSGSAARAVPRPAPHYEATSRTPARRAPMAMGVTSLASLSAVTSFLFIPYAPAWSILVIAIDALVIWALVSPRRAWA